MELLRRPDISYDTLMSLDELGPGAADFKVAEQVEIQAKYGGYVDRQLLEIERQRRHEETTLSSALDYRNVKGLSSEVC